MKIGGYLMVRNEADVLERLIRYYLELQGINLLYVIDNGSTDETPRILERLKSSRLILETTPLQQGYAQSEMSTRAAKELFEKYHCDWVLPIDADEYWHSQKYGSVRKALENAPVKASILVTYAYNFFESERDDPAETDFLRRLTCCRLSRAPKIVMKHLAGKIQTIVDGNHGILLDPRFPVESEVMHPQELVRFHYPYISVQNTLRKILNQVEGFVIQSRGEWLRGDSGSGKHIFRWYRALKDGRFEKMYKKSAWVSEEEIRNSSGDNPVYIIKDMRMLFPPVQE